MSSVQFAFQMLMAKGVFASGLMQRTASPMEWKEWCRLGEGGNLNFVGGCLNFEFFSSQQIRADNLLMLERSIASFGGWNHPPF